MSSYWWVYRPLTRVLAPRASFRSICTDGDSDDAGECGTASAVIRPAEVGSRHEASLPRSSKLTGPGQLQVNTRVDDQSTSLNTGQYSLQIIHPYTEYEIQKSAALVEGAARTVSAGEHGREYTLATEVEMFLCNVKAMVYSAISPALILAGRYANHLAQSRPSAPC